MRLSVFLPTRFVIEPIICFTCDVGDPSEKIICFTYDVGAPSEKIIWGAYDVGKKSFFAFPNLGGNAQNYPAILSSPYQ
jgi:hypothetical protein